MAADAQGVHVVWSARDADGQAKIFARNSANGLSWTAPSVTLDTHADRAPVLPGHRHWRREAVGHLPGLALRPRLFAGSSAREHGGWHELGQWRARLRGALDQRRHELDRVAGERRWDRTPTGRCAARCARRSSATTTTCLRSAHRPAPSGPTRETCVPGQDPRETNADDDMDGFDGFQTCTWVPNDINAGSYSSPTIDDPCHVAGRPRREHLRGYDALGRLER